MRSGQSSHSSTDCGENRQRSRFEHKEVEGLPSKRKTPRSKVVSSVPMAVSTGERVDSLRPWFVRLRWIALLGQLLLATLAPMVLAVDLDVVPLCLILIAVALSNLVLMHPRFSQLIRGRPFAESNLCGVVVLFDVAALTGLLYFSGGAANPFGFFYVLHVAIAALLLGERWAWGISALSMVLCGGLFFFYVPVSGLSMHEGHDHGSLSLHLKGMWLAFALVSAALAFFFTRMIREMKRQEGALSAAHERLERAQRLAAVTAMGATAAHELNTPLCTIAVAAGEMSKTLRSRGTDSELATDADLVVEQVTRCREVLGRLRRATGDFEGQMLTEVPLVALVSEVKERFSPAERHRVFVEGQSADMVLAVPRDAFVDVLRALVSNALEASGESPVEILATRSPQFQQVQVRDRGTGIRTDILDQLGAPFVTSKTPDLGLGLGVFLVKSIVERMRGSLRFVSTEGQGTTAIVEIPV